MVADYTQNIFLLVELMAKVPTIISHASNVLIGQDENLPCQFKVCPRTPACAMIAKIFKHGRAVLPKKVGHFFDHLRDRPIPLIFGEQ